MLTRPGAPGLPNKLSASVCSLHSHAPSPSLASVRSPSGDDASHAIISTNGWPDRTLPLGESARGWRVLIHRLGDRACLESCRASSFFPSFEAFPRGCLRDSVVPVSNRTSAYRANSIFIRHGGFLSSGKSSLGGISERLTCSVRRRETPR